jgi:hypothetical protein
MAVPTVLTVTPGAGHTGGRTVVEVTGTNFRLPTPPAPTGITTPPPPSVQVLFGGKLATAVAVVSPTLLYCQAPIHDPGTVDVVVRNVDDSGAIIGSETATLAACYAFQRPDLTVERSELARCMEAFILEMRRQIIDAVDWAVHTDYDASTGDMMNIAYMGSLPALVLSDLELPENRTASEGTYEVDIDENTYVERRAPIMVDANFTVMGIASDPPTLLNLLQAVRTFFKKNPQLVYDRDKDDSTRGTIAYDMGAVVSGRVRASRQADNSNVVYFTGEVVIENIRLEDMPGITRAAVPGVPAWLPHEATIRYGWIADQIIVNKTQRKT